MLRIQSLTCAIATEQGWVTAVDDFTLQIPKGETCALVGESGSGKTMTALTLLRLLPQGGQIRSGKVELGDKDLFALREWEMRKVRGKKIAIIFQEPSTSLNPVQTVGDQLLEMIGLHTELRGAAARAKASDWLVRVGLHAEMMTRYPFQLSGGQKQRVMIAIALSAEPELLIADEPTTALDVTIQAQILDLLKTLRAELGMSMLLITHDLGIVAQMADRVALMYAGQIVEVADTQTFLRQPQHPYARMLLDALPGVAKRGSKLNSISGLVPSLASKFVGCRFAERCPLRQEKCTNDEISLLGEQHRVRCLRPGTVLPATEVRLSVATQPPSVTPPLLQARGLKVSYPVGSNAFGVAKHWRAAVQELSFTLHAGKTLALVGESGSGKTTAGKAMMRLLDRIAKVEGQVDLDGCDLLHAQDRQLQQMRQHVQMVFQDPFSSLNPRMRILDVLIEGLAVFSRDRQGLEAKAATLMEQVGLSAQSLQKYPHEFSGGQRQRIAIARALAVQPKVLICDEPTSALDISVQAQILNLLRELQEAYGLALLFITHNLGVVEYLADYVVVMQEGVVVEQGAVESIMNTPQHPYTQKLLAAMPTL